MKQFLFGMFRIVAKIGNRVLSKAIGARHALLGTAARQQRKMEAERLDRLRNPGDYRGK